MFRIQRQIQLQHIDPGFAEHTVQVRVRPLFPRSGVGAPTRGSSVVAVCSATSGLLDAGASRAWERGGG